MINQDSELTAKIWKQILLNSKLNAYRIAKKTGIDKTYLSKLMNGVIAKPGKDKLSKIAQVLNIEVAKLQQIFSDPVTAIQELGLENIVSNSLPPIKSQEDWGAAPDGIICYHRETEIHQIKQWILDRHCRLVTLFGLGGIGKTTVAIEVARQLRGEFDYVLWRTLDHVSLIETLIQDALCLFGNPKPKLNTVQQITELLQYLRSHRCLIILDGVETILATGKSLHPYEYAYRAYGELFRQIAQSKHQSCLLLVSSEKPRDLAIWESSSALIHSYQLQGSTQVSYRILEDKQIPYSAAWNELISAYRGHPSALKIVATLINELFNGDVAEFLRQNTLFIGDLSSVLHQQYERLGDRERQILHTIAEADKPLSLQELNREYNSKLKCSEIMDCLNSLKRRSLLDTVAELTNSSESDSFLENKQQNPQNFYSVQPIVGKYIKCLSTGQQLK